MTIFPENPSLASKISVRLVTNMEVCVFAGLVLSFDSVKKDLV
jgi:hypothetical protein